MRVQINLEAINYHNQILDFDHQYKLFSLISNLLKKTEYKGLHDNGEMKNYVFTNLTSSKYVLIKNAEDKTKNGMLLYSNHLHFIISSSDENFINVLINQFENTKGMSLKTTHNTLILSYKGHKLINEAIIEKDECIFMLETPVYLDTRSEKTGKNRSVFIEEPYYLDRLKKNISSKTKCDLENIKIEILKDTIKHKVRRFVDMSGNYDYVGYQYKFKIKAPINVLKTLYNEGIGVNTGRGFGYLKIDKYGKY